MPRARISRSGLMVVAVLLLVTSLAGCAESGSGKSREIVVESNVMDVSSNETKAKGYEPSPKTLGHIAGIVVDQAIRPLEGISVRLPGLDLVSVTDREGAFGFVDLRPGPYYITAEHPGFAKAETELAVDADEFTRVKFILRAIPPPTPRHITLKYAGFADMTDNKVVGGSFMCNACAWGFYVDGDGFRGLTLEAVMDPASSPNSNDFRYVLDDDVTGSPYVSSGSQTNPMHVIQRLSAGQAVDRYNLRITPQSFPAPEFSKKFDVFVTQWFNQDPPQDWSFLTSPP